MKTFIAITTISFAAMTFGCGGQANTNVATTNLNANAANQNAVAANASNAATAPATTSDATVGSLATPTDAYRTAYAMREKKDLAGLKKVMSQDVIEFLTMMAEEEKKTIDDQISELFLKPQWKTAETRNEQIKGDRATIEYRDENGAFKTMDFVKEGQDWKLSLPSPDDVEIETGPPGKKRN